MATIWPVADATNDAAAHFARRNPFRQAWVFIGFALRWVATFVTLALYLVVAPWGYAVFAIMVVWPTQDPEARARRLQAAMRGGFTLMHRWLGWFRLVDVQIQVSEDDLPDGPCVVVANHPTMMDVTAILRAVRGGCTIVSPKYYRIWWLKPLMEGSGQLEGATNPLAAASLVERAVRRIREGTSFVIFPESTRTEPGRAMPFHRLAFEIASRAQVPVVALRMRSEPPYVSKDRPIHRLPSSVPLLAVSRLATIDPAHFDHDSRRLCEHVRDMYRQLPADDMSFEDTYDERRVG